MTPCGSVSVLCVATTALGLVRVRAGRVHAEAGGWPDLLYVSDRVLCAAGAVGAAVPLRPTKMAVVC